MKITLSFGTIFIIADNIAEVVINDGVTVTMEMVEEYHDALENYFKGDFALFINKVHQYNYTFEAKLTIAAHENLKAIAFIFYTPQCQEITDDLIQLRNKDGWNAKLFSGLNLERQQAMLWLEQELTMA